MYFGNALSVTARTRDGNPSTTPMSTTIYIITSNTVKILSNLRMSEGGV